MKKLEQFIEKKRVDNKFKKAGAGHSLQEERKVPESRPGPAPSRAQPSQSAQEAGQRALERFKQAQRTSKPKRDLTVLRSQAKQDINSEQQGAVAAPTSSKRDQRNQPSPAFYDQDAPIAVRGIFYQCPLCATTACQPDLTSHMEDCFLTDTLYGPNYNFAVRPGGAHENRIPLGKFGAAGEQRKCIGCPAFRDQDAPNAVHGILYQCPLCAPNASTPDLTSHMQECFLTLVAADPIQGTCTMMNSLNRDIDKLESGKSILCKYIDNVCNNPGDDKYCKIRVGNKAFQERVLPLKGSLEFLQAVGFQQKELPHQDAQELFWVLPEEFSRDLDRLSSFKEQLQSAETIRPALSRDMKVLRPTGGTQRIHLPDEFFRITAEEAKKEQENRREVIDKSEQLRTKAMKDADEQNEKRQYRYSLIRVRFPDGYILQGTFHARDRFSEVVTFVRSCLINDWQPFFLSDPTGPLQEREHKSLLDLKLAPAAQLIFSWDPQILAEMAAAQGTTETNSPLKPELLASSQTL